MINLWITMRTMIKYLRQELKMSQKELGDKVGVTRQTINALENGRYNPSLFLAYEITQIEKNTLSWKRYSFSMMITIR